MINFYEEITSIDNKLKEEGAIQDNFDYSEKEYRESLKREIELLSQKDEVLNKQITLDKMQIHRAAYDDTEKKSFGIGTVSVTGKVKNQPIEFEEEILNSLHRIEEILKNSQSTINVNTTVKVEEEKTISDIINKEWDGIEKQVKY